MSKNIYSSILGIKTSLRAINIDYPLHTEVDSLIVFPPNWVILIPFTAEKHPNLGIWAQRLLDKNWATSRSLAAGEKPDLPRFGALKFWQHCTGVDPFTLQGNSLPDGLSLTWPKIQLELNDSNDGICFVTLKYKK